MAYNRCNSDGNTSYCALPCHRKRERKTLELSACLPSAFSFTGSICCIYRTVWLLACTVKRKSFFIAVESIEYDSSSAQELCFPNSLNPVMNSFGVREPLPSASSVTKTFSSSSRLRGNSGCSLCNDKTRSSFNPYYRIRGRRASTEHPWY